MPTLFDPALQRKLEERRVVAVLTIDREADAVPLARALLAGGVDLMELTLRTPAALAALERISADVPEMTVGIGTILSPGQVRDAHNAGAAFGVAPGLNPRVLQTAMDVGLSFAPGIVTPTDIEQALELGCRLLKWFPAEASGGLPYLKSMAAPYAHLGVRYIPLGGIDIDNMGAYLADPRVAAIGGSWLAPRGLMDAGDWSGITALAQAARLRADA